MWIFLTFLVLYFFAICHGYYTRTGSGINQRPTTGRAAMPPAPRSPARSGAMSPGATTRAARADSESRARAGGRRFVSRDAARRLGRLYQAEHREGDGESSPV